MKRYVYPAVFTPEKNGQYSVNFPDLEGCYTCGDDLADAIFMAEDVLAFTLYRYEKEKTEIPDPSRQEDLKLSEGEFTNLVVCDTLKYRKMHDKTAVKKTLTIPAWLNTCAQEAGVNFSGVLQEALVERLQLG